MKENEHYFMFLTQSDAEQIVRHAYSKEIHPKVWERQQYLQNLLQKTGYFDKKKGKYWTLFKARKVWKKGDPPGAMVKMGSYATWQDFDLNAAKAAYCAQRGLDANGNKKPTMSQEQQMKLAAQVHLLMLKAFLSPAAGETYQEQLRRTGTYTPK